MESVFTKYFVQKLNPDGTLVWDDKGVGTIQGREAGSLSPNWVISAEHAKHAKLPETI